MCKSVLAPSHPVGDSTRYGSAAGTRAEIQPQRVPAMTSRGRSLPTVTSVHGGTSRDVPVLHLSEGGHSSAGYVLGTHEHQENVHEKRICPAVGFGVVASKFSAVGVRGLKETIGKVQCEIWRS